MFIKVMIVKFIVFSFEVMNLYLYADFSSESFTYVMKYFDLLPINYYHGILFHSFECAMYEKKRRERNIWPHSTSHLIILEKAMKCVA